MIHETIKRLSVLAAIGLIGAPAAAQVTLPPKPSAEAETYTPPPKRAAPARPTASPQSQRGNLATAPVPRHRPLAEAGEDGFIVIPDRLPDEVALERNPYIGESKNDAIHDLRVERQARMERQVIENLDLFTELETGVIDEIVLSNLEGMQKVAQMIQPLIADPSLTHELKERGVLTRIQSEGNSGIVRQFQVAVNEELKERYPDDNLDHFMRFIMNASIQEARLAYRLLLDEGASKIGELRSQEVIPNATDALAMVRDAETLRVALSALSLEEHQDVLRAIIAMRDEPTSPPVVRIDFGEGKTTQKVGEIEKRVRPDGGIEVRTGAVQPKGDEEELPDDGG